jgi:hypothetical protein
MVLSSKMFEFVMVTYIVNFKITFTFAYLSIVSPFVIWNKKRLSFTFSLNVYSVPNIVLMQMISFDYYSSYI